ncbi:MAG: radical SAM protein [Phycisphaerae bacterium]
MAATHENPRAPAGRNPAVHMWQNNMCITYTTVFRRFEDFFRANGCAIRPTAEEADVLVVGACAGFLPQIDEWMEKMRQLTSLAKPIVVYGCLPRIAPQRFAEVAGGVSLHIPPEQPEGIARLVPDLRVPWEAVADPCGFRREDYRSYDPGKAYLIIQYGCEADCVYCPHKIGMGPHFSRPLSEVAALARSAVADGAHTLFLEGMDSGSWGTDLVPPQTYVELLRALLGIPGDFQIHISQFGANWLLRYGQGLLETFAHPRVTDIKVPIQSMSPRLLKLMGRDPRVEQIGGLLKALRGRKEDLNLRTDLIIGFPTETEAELQRTLEFASEHFDEIACYGFELHPSAPIARMDLALFDDELIERRVERALTFLNLKGGIITHRGGQVPDTLLERERLIARRGRLRASSSRRRLQRTPQARPIKRPAPLSTHQR